MRVFGAGLATIVLMWAVAHLAPALQAHGPMPVETAMRTAPPPPGPQKKRLPARAWRANAKALEIIKEEEQLRLTSYRLAGDWLIGFGHKHTARPGMRITRDKAHTLLARDVAECESAVGRIIATPVTRDEFSAMVALCYNIGQGAFARSSIAQRMNAGDRAGAAEAFLLWTKMRVDGTLIKSTAIERRRERERALFLSL